MSGPPPSAFAAPGAAAGVTEPARWNEQATLATDVAIPLLADLLRLPEQQAVQRYFDGRNWRMLRWSLGVFAVGAPIGAIVALTNGRLDLAALWGFVALFNLGILLAHRRPAFLTYARQVLIAYLMVHAAATTLSMPESEPAYAFAGWIFPFALILFRMRWLEYLTVGASLVALATWFVTRPGMPEALAPRLGMILPALLWTLIAVGLAVRVTRRHRELFLGEFRHELMRGREEARMRGELLDAREIQLSMLPRSTPELPWLKASGLSIPASEVGGDYYEYFQLDDSRLALVIGDVAGHGVASGLVLSGVRSGLHLLREELARPVTVVEKLDRMVRETAPRRMFVTLQVALVDRRDGTVRVANAGHPPALLVREGEDCRQLGDSGLPLGTRLEGRFVEAEQRLLPGDVLVFYSDGVPEARNLAGESFGEERLRREAKKAAGRPARAVRDALVNAVSRFKGDAVQADDLTLVVLRLEAAAE